MCSSDLALVAIHPLFAAWVAILAAIVIGVILAVGIGYLYGQLLNRVKGSEMTVTLLPVHNSFSGGAHSQAPQSSSYQGGVPARYGF